MRYSEMLNKTLLLEDAPTKIQMKKQNFVFFGMCGILKLKL